MAVHALLHLQESSHQKHVQRSRIFRLKCMTPQYRNYYVHGRNTSVEKNLLEKLLGISLYVECMLQSQPALRSCQPALGAAADCIAALLGPGGGH